MDIQLGPDGDIVIVNGDLVLVRDAEFIGQRVRMRLQTWLAESVYDTAAGFPWLEGVFGKQPIAGIRFLIDQHIRDTDGVQDVEELDFDIDAQARTLTVTGKILVDEIWIDITVEVTPP